MKLLALTSCFFCAGILALRAERPGDWAAPLVKSEGKIVVLPQAAFQPQAGSKAVFNITAQAEADQVAKGLVRVARWLNLNTAGGVPPKKIQVALVLHGDATKAALRHEAYKKHTGGARNPSLELLREFKSHGVEIYVCGQALAHHGYRDEEVAGEVETATAALSVLIQKQGQGYAFLPY